MQLNDIKETKRKYNIGITGTSKRCTMKTKTCRKLIPPNIKKRTQKEHNDERGEISKYDARKKEKEKRDIKLINKTKANQNTNQIYTHTQTHDPPDRMHDNFKTTRFKCC